jgi:hypothetical protein
MLCGDLREMAGSKSALQNPTGGAVTQAVHVVAAGLSTGRVKAGLGAYRCWTFSGRSRRVSRERYARL